LTGTVRTSDFSALRSVCWCTSVPFRLTLAFATPLLEVTMAATTVAASLTRAISCGYRNATVSGTRFSK
jgi:hypothetical protein